MRHTFKLIELDIYFYRIYRSSAAGCAAPQFAYSIVTAATPGYAGYSPASGLYTLIAGAEAIFGTFMWAAFIATFARKWQR